MKKEISNPVEAYSDGGPHIRILKQCNSSNQLTIVLISKVISKSFLLDYWIGTTKQFEPERKFSSKKDISFKAWGLDTKDANFSCEQLVKKSS